MAHLSDPKHQRHQNFQSQRYAEAIYRQKFAGEDGNGGVDTFIPFMDDVVKPAYHLKELF